MPSATITVIIADAQVITRNGLAKTLEAIDEIQVIGTTGCLEEMVALCNHHKPDIIMISAAMPGIDNVKPYRYITAEFPGVHAIIIADDNDFETTIAMKTAGEFAWLYKSATEEKIVTTIRAVHAGTYIQELYNGYSTNAVNRSLLNTLTPMEKEILPFFSADLTAKEIAAIQKVSPRTIEGYKEKLKEKLQVKGRVGLAVYAFINNTYLHTLLYWVWVLVASDTPDAIFADIAA